MAVRQLSAKFAYNVVIQFQFEFEQKEKSTHVCWKMGKRAPCSVVCFMGVILLAKLLFLRFDVRSVLVRVLGAVGSSGDQDTSNFQNLECPTR
jgi:hypothetical protein